MDIFLFFLIVVIPVGMFSALGLVNRRSAFGRIPMIMVLLISFILYTMVSGTDVGDLLNPFNVLQMVEDDSQDVEIIHTEVYVEPDITDYYNYSQVEESYNTTINSEDLFDMEMYDDLLSIDDI